MKIVALVLCMSVLVASQELMGDNFGRLMAFNMLSGRQPFDFSSLFGAGSQDASASGQRGAAAGRGANMGGFAGLLMFDAI